MTTLVLVRHGQASFGAATYDCLSEIGRRQSRIVGEHFAQTGLIFDAAYSGTMVRQKNTAAHAFEVLASAPTLVPTPAFDEYDFDGILRGYLPLVAREQPQIVIERRELFANPKLFQIAFESAIGCWLAGREPDGKLQMETWQTFRERVVAGARAAAQPQHERAAAQPQCVVVFTSGGVIAALLREALGLSNDMCFRMNWRIYNASLHIFRVGRNGISLLGFNNIAPLELKNDPSLLTFR